MLRSTSVVLVSVVLGCFLVDCSSSDSSSGSSNTIGAQCDTVLGAYCSRIIVGCAVSGQGTVADCESGGRTDCCASSCGERAISSDSSIKACTDVINSTPCSTLYDGTSFYMPAECKGVVKRPASLAPGEATSAFGTQFASGSAQ